MLAYMSIIIQGVMLVESIFNTFLPLVCSDFISVSFPVGDSRDNFLDSNNNNLRKMNLFEKMANIKVLWSFNPWNIPSNYFNRYFFFSHIQLAVFPNFSIYNFS